MSFQNSKVDVRQILPKLLFIDRLILLILIYLIIMLKGVNLMTLIEKMYETLDSIPKQKPDMSKLFAGTTSKGTSQSLKCTNEK